MKFAEISNTTFKKLKKNVTNQVFYVVNFQIISKNEPRKVS